MSGEWLTTMKPSFLTEWMALPAKESRQIGQKIELLTRDPTPDAKVKKQLKYMNGRLHRIRSGDYRLFYTFDHPYISLLALRRRDNDTYDEDLDTEFLGGLDPQFIGSSRVLPDWERMFARREPEKTPLPEPISVELLSSLRVPEVYHQRLELVRTREDLFDCPGISDEIKLQVDEYLFERPLVERLAEPDYLTGDISDLLRYKGGELLAFLLKLDPGQERVVDWALNSGAPTLVKGGPGTGKSILALYRVRSMIHALREAGVDQPRILFTTYTHALASYSEQLLCRLLGPDAGCVRVRTADSCAYEIAGSIPGPRAPAPDGELKYLLKQAIAVALLEGNALQASAQAMALEQMSADYLLDELSKVIEARELVTLDAYLKAPRSGRRVPLNRTQRTAVWLVHEAFNRQLVLKGRRTWQQMRRQALEAVRSGAWSERYDGVIVDEAQDLDPTLIRMLAELCKEPNGLLLTADANQSIYGSGFRWADVREDLRIQGRTVVLRVNHRSTREIGDAARSYLQEGALESYEQEPTYISSGPRPVVYSSTSAEDESNFL
ncbi:MAG TPA: UvrD-helicase domain-containing protein, partial [Dehalococcoidia bacterium]|nr:UvrD-helicase domain-containing protein [Dehalococcoidia bacterium]